MSGGYAENQNITLSKAQRLELAKFKKSLDEKYRN